MEQQLKACTAATVEKLYQKQVSPDEILVNIPPRDFPYDFTIVAFPFSKLSRKSPDQTAKEIGEDLRLQIPMLETIEIITGFINLKLKEEYWSNFLKENISDNTYGQFPSSGQKVMVEYCGPNTNKPLHLGHLR